MTICFLQFVSISSSMFVIKTVVRKTRTLVIEMCFGISSENNIYKKRRLDS